MLDRRVDDERREKRRAYHESRRERNRTEQRNFRATVPTRLGSRYRPTELNRKGTRIVFRLQRRKREGEIVHEFKLATSWRHL